MANTGGLAFPLQQLMAAYGDRGPVNDWIFQKPGRDDRHPGNLQAAQHLQKWIDGYFPTTSTPSGLRSHDERFSEGQGLFIFNGDWESGNLDKQMAGKAGFFLIPRPRPGASRRRCRRR